MRRGITLVRGAGFPTWAVGDGDGRGPCVSDTINPLCICAKGGVWWERNVELRCFTGSNASSSPVRGASFIMNHRPTHTRKPAHRRTHTRRPVRTAAIITGSAAAVGITIAAVTGCNPATTAAPPPASTSQPAQPAMRPSTVAPANHAAAVIGTWSGSGNEATPKFNVPDGGDYIVTWSYSGNADQYGPSNFILSNTGEGFGLGLPNDIAKSGHGSTEITGDSGTESFNVQSMGHWTISVKPA